MENNTITDISKLCRSCMKEVASWEKDNFYASAVEMFCFCTNIKIIDDENLPKQFCYDCIIKIESCHTFIKEAQNINITLKNIASRSAKSVIIKPETANAIEEPNKLRLTLPDYKLSIGINFDNQGYFKDIDKYKEKLSQNFSQSAKQINNNAEPQNTKFYINEDTKENETSKNICTICRKSFVSKKWFAKHIEKEHSGHKYTCAYCPKSFSKQFQLAYHTTSHTNDRKFSCTTCSKSFKYRKQLTIHTRSHSDVRPYACDKCSMRFKMKSVLKCHMKVHDVKQYLCSYCGWSFGQAHNLQVHLRTHTGLKPHACTECGFRTAAVSSLRRHQRRHTDSRLYVCTHCRKGFYDASGLARHTRTHTGELPYKCPGCARSFADSWKRKTHLMRAHRLALADIPRMRTDGRALTDKPLHI